MPTRKKNLLRHVGAVAVVAVLSGGGTAFAGAEVGTIAPDFTLEGHDGNTYTLSDYLGEVVFLAHIGYN